MPRREKELRCFCKNNPLLATYGLDSKGTLFLHVKVYKGNRIYTELVLEAIGSIIKIRCRNCLRWHRVRIVGHDADLTDTSVPETQSRGT